MVEYEEYKSFLGKEHNCNFCEGNDLKEWGRRGIFKLDQCNNCGLVYINPRLNEDGLNKLYSTYFDGREQDVETTEKRKLMYQLEVDFILKHLKHHNTILDVGCGGGLFLDKFPPSLTKLATDYDSIAAKEAENKGIKCYVGDLLDIEIKEAPLDVVMFRGVIEHVVDPKKTLEKVSHLLAPKGLLYITSIPDLNSVCAELYRGQWNLVVPDHLYYMNEPLLTGLLIDMNLTLLDKYHFYEETPYANPLSDYQQICRDLRKLRNGEKIKDTSPAYWGNMMSLVYQKN